MNDDRFFSLNEVREILEYCGVDAYQTLLNWFLESKGTVGFCIRRIFYLIDFLELQRDSELASHLRNIIPTSITAAKKDVMGILEYLKIQRYGEGVVGSEDAVGDNNYATVKDVIGYFKEKYRKDVKSYGVCENKDILELLYAPLSLNEIVKSTDGKPIRYSFVCANCNIPHNVGYFYRCGANEYEVCKFCVDDIKNKSISQKLIYTPMGNKR